MDNVRREGDLLVAEIRRRSGMAVFYSNSARSEGAHLYVFALHKLQLAQQLFDVQKVPDAEPNQGA